MSEPTWWLVITRPSAETTEPEPPVSKRTQERWRCSSHSGMGVKWYLSWSCLVGGALRSHMPSSAREGTAASRGQSATRRAEERLAVGIGERLGTAGEL